MARSPSTILRSRPIPLLLVLVERRLHRNFQGYTTDQAATIIAFGASSIGRLPQGYVQDASRTPHYNAAISRGGPAIVRGVAPSPDDRASVIEPLMCLLAVDPQSVSAGQPDEADGLRAERLPATVWPMRDRDTARQPDHGSRPRPVLFSAARAPSSIDTFVRGSTRQPRGLIPVAFTA